jgi:hypothetical protein
MSPSITLAEPLTTLEYTLYLAGWLLWIPAYVAAIKHLYFSGSSRRACIIPTVAVCANAAFEGLWFVIGDFTHAPLVKWLYLGAFLLDLPILIGVLIYGDFGTFRRPAHEVERFHRRDRLQHYAVITVVFAFWIALYLGLRYSYEVPFGSVGAYVDNAVMSALFVWREWLYPRTPNARFTAWSKFLGTAVVTIYIALQYRGLHHLFLYVIAGGAFLLDVVYVVLVYRREPPAPAQQADTLREVAYQF